MCFSLTACAKGQILRLANLCQVAGIDYKQWHARCMYAHNWLQSVYPLAFATPCQACEPYAPYKHAQVPFLQHTSPCPEMNAVDSSFSGAVGGLGGSGMFLGAWKFGNVRRSREPSSKPRRIAPSRNMSRMGIVFSNVLYPVPGPKCVGCSERRMRSCRVCSPSATYLGIQC